MRSLFPGLPASILTKITPSLFCIALIGGCSHNLSNSDGDRLAQAITTEGFATYALPFKGFSLRAAWRSGSGQQPALHVYLEGDGRAWKSRSRLSADPTPRAPIGLRLAEADSEADVLYIARPCQYLLRRALRKCDPAFWSSHRYADSVVAALNAAVDRIRLTRSTAKRRLTMIGYSGGGALAVLVAARRNDVAKLITVAANLDTLAWTRAHGVSPLSGSLNPVQFAAQVASIPQRHFVGERDKIVAPEIVQGFVSAIPNPTDAKAVVVPDYTHECCWQENWPAFVAGL